MLSDARRIKPGAVWTTDVCVVGGGAAGITVAHELMDSGLSVVLLESGDFAYEAETQALYQGDESGTYLKPESEYLTATRLRVIGGSTGHWNGWCRPFDPEDFEPRDWVADSGWPISRSDLDAHYERVNELLGLPPFDDEADAGDLPILLPGGSPFETTFLHVNAVRFSRTYAVVLRRARGKVARVVKHANLTEIEVDENGGRVTGVTAETLSGNSFRVRARAYVLAAGGIENARLLLASNRVVQNGLGNDHDLVGRCFMEHPFVRIGHVLSVDQRFIDRGSDPYVERPSGLPPAQLVGCLRLRAADQQRHRLLNGLFVLRPVRGGAFPELTAQVGMLARELAESEGVRNPTWELSFAGEQTPNHASRVRLVTERDALGMQRTGLDWQITEQDIANVRRSTELFAAELGASFRGRLHLLPERDEPFARWSWSNHHMGTTRMSTDPRRGVVDVDSRVHGIANLFVTGSSVFPTSGCSNPTLTLLALSVRLARHLRQALAAG